MDAERWQRLSPLLDALLELDAPTRARSLALTRAEDPALADELQALLALEQDNEDFLDTPLVAPLAGPRPGAEIGPYRLLTPLGEGGMGQVWLASRADGLYQKRVALKLLRPGLADPDLRLRFTRERQILARLEHPHIARLFDAGISGDGQPYLALEYIEGEPITDWCRNRQADVDTVLALFMQVCAAVSHAHANLVVHRDLKPSNVLVTNVDEVRLLDFGIAKLLDGGSESPEHTRTDQRAFTLHYAAPEQILGEPVSTMTDVYALGVILYELLAGTRPYRIQRDSGAQWEEAVLRQDPQRPSQALLRSLGADTPDAGRLRRQARRIAGDLDNIVLKAMAKRPEQRYPSVEALALDVQRYRDGLPVQARRQSLRYRAHKFITRHPWPLASASAALLVAGLSMALVGWQARQALREAKRAQVMQDFVIGLFEEAGSSGDAQGAAGLQRLLESAGRRGERGLADEPLAQAELFGIIARLRMGLGDPLGARDALQRQAQLLQGIDKVPPTLQHRARLDEARADFMLGHAGHCVQLLEPNGRGGEPAPATRMEQAERALLRGRCLMAEARTDKAGQSLQDALALYREAGNPAGVAEAQMELATLELPTQPQRAVAAYYEAQRELATSIDRNPALALELKVRLGEALLAQGDPARARAVHAEAMRLAADLQGANPALRQRLALLQRKLPPPAAPLPDQAPGPGPLPPPQPPPSAQPVSTEAVR